MRSLHRPPGPSGPGHPRSPARAICERRHTREFPATFRSLVGWKRSTNPAPIQSQSPDAAAMNDFDPFTSPRSYARPFNGAHDLECEQAHDSRCRCPAIWQAAFWLTLLVIAALVGLGLPWPSPIKTGTLPPSPPLATRNGISSPARQSWQITVSQA